MTDPVADQAHPSLHEEEAGRRREQPYHCACGERQPHELRLVLVRGTVVFDGPPSGLPDLWHDPTHVHA